ncbi:hypothetical protein C2S52_013745 [Perilla frutescens var. hirtella]|nr:hypothetical protein C2S52_013745 [Perilla frutescens var. hirtella]
MFKKLGKTLKNELAGYRTLNFAKTKIMNGRRMKSVAPFYRKKQTTLTITYGKELQAKVRTVALTEISDIEDDRESVASSFYVVSRIRDSIPQTVQDEETASSHHITLDEGTEIEEKDAEEAPPQLEEGVKATMDELKEVNLGSTDDPRPTYISALLTTEEEESYVGLLKEFKNVSAWSYKEMSGLDPKLKMNPLKCAFGVKSGKFLGFIVRHQGIAIEQVKIDAILKMPEPRNIHDLKSLQGSRIMKKGVSFEWDESCRNAFKSIKEYLMKAPVLVAPVAGRPLILYIAAQERSVRALLAQENENEKENALYYLSRMMTPNELKYSPVEKLCLSLIFSIKKLKHYFQAHTVRLISKTNPLKYVMMRSVMSDRLACWYLQLQQFEIIYVPQKAVKGQVLAYFLADHPIPAEWELDDDLPDEDVLAIEVLAPWKMYFDGASHREGAGTGVVFITLEGEVLPYSFTLTENCSNNVAEYQALILGSEMAMDAKRLQIKVYGDCKVVIYQLLGSYDVKKPELISYVKYAQRMIGWLGDVELEHVLRKENKQADALAKLASTIAIPGSKIHIPIFKIFEIDKEDWPQPFVDYLKYDKLPSDPRRRVDIRRRANRFIYFKGTLYMRSFDGVFLRCLGDKEAVKAMEETHSGICGAHKSGPQLHFRIKRMGYYWPTMVKDYMDYAQRCQPCQFHANLIYQPPEPLHPTVAPWPFDAWGLDVVEAVPLKEVKKENIADFIKGNIIYRYGIPRYIITDNGKPFSNALINKLCEKFGFKQRKSSMYNAAANGLAEAFNKTLCNLLKKMVGKSKRDWYERIGEALWAYRTTHWTPTQATPYLLVYGVEAIIPLEQQISSLRITIQESLTEEENARLRLEELEALDEKRLEAQQRLDCYQARLSRTFNKKVRPRSFQVGDLVLAMRRPIVTTHHVGNKFIPR